MPMRKKLILCFLSFINLNLCATPHDSISKEEANFHQISPYIFFKTHKEKHYKYKIVGSGLKYRQKKDVGFSFEIDIKYNLDNILPFYENRWAIHYKFPFNEKCRIYPIYSRSSSSHCVEKNKLTQNFINISSSSLGIGYEQLIEEMIKFEIQFHLMKEKFNSYITQNVKSNGFFGSSFFNPKGIYGNISIYGLPKSSLQFMVATSYLKTFPKLYEEFTLKGGIKWSF